ncbi:hypothetical protein R3M60_20580, partial [Bacillus subtilis]|nr:hypothetical protein [Bacillus subtilis]
GPILILQYHANAFLSLPLVVCPIVEIRRVMSGFVAMNVISDDPLACDVFRFGKKLIRQVHREKLIHMPRELFLSAHQFDH